MPPFIAACTLLAASLAILSLSPTTSSVEALTRIVAVELAISRDVEELKKDLRGMATFGINCVTAALRRPFMQIAANAGFNPLEKLGDVTKAQVEQKSFSLGIDCDTGDLADMFELGVVDPTLVKVHALKAAGEVAEAILRIDTIIRKKEIKSSGEQ
ncbi:MAG: hypothetical protein GXW85_12345 [Clostridia bacterium]|nr:hypothetical protein [Clostridia bacterium]